MKILARLLIIIGCIILVGCNNQNVDSLEPTPSQPNFSEETEEEIIDENKEAINVYLFWGNGCHICENLMNYFEELEKRAKQSFEKFMIYIDENSHLITNVDEENDNTVIEVIYWEENNEDLIGRFYFNEEGDFLKIE